MTSKSYAAKGFKIFIIVISVFLITFMYLIVRGITIEDYCINLAKLNNTASQQNMLQPTEEEKREIPGIGTITPTFRFERNCEKQQKIFLFF